MTDLAMRALKERGVFAAVPATASVRESDRVRLEECHPAIAVDQRLAWLRHCDANGLDHRTGQMRADLQQAQPNVRGPGGADAERVGSGLGQVDDAPLNVRAAIVHFDDDGSSRVEVGHFDLRPEGQGFVSGGQSGGVEGVAARGEVSLEAGPVPARAPGLVVVAGGAAAPGAVGGVAERGREGPTDDPPKAA